MKLTGPLRWIGCALRPCRHRPLGGRIFLCYRWDDSGGQTTHLEDILQDRFGKQMVFRDITNILPGEDYRDAIRKELQSCYAVLVIIGRRWLTVTDPEGRRRIDYERDALRTEIELALDEPRIRLIPILVDGAGMPPARELPAPMKRLAYRIAEELSYRSFRADAERLIKRLETPRPPRFAKWDDIRSGGSARPTPVWALVANALWRPFWTNVLVPLGLVIGAFLIPAYWLIPVAAAIYVGLSAITLFDLQQARCVRECLEESAHERSSPPPVST